MRKVPASVALLLALLALPLHAQAVLRLEGRTVEVVGLRQWTVEMLQDSLAAYAPGVALDGQMCAAALRYRLNFPEAAATVYLDGGPPYILISLVEPQDSGRVHHRALPFDTTIARPEWAAAAEIARRRPDLFHLAVARYHPETSAGGQPAYPARPGQDTALVKRIWHFLESHRGESDLAAALKTLASGEGMYDRMVAAAVLGNFTDHDASWWMLAEALRESDGPVKATASTVLISRARANPRAVDWGPAAETIHALLNGTALFEFRGVLEWLPSMGAGPRWSTAFLAGGGEMVLAYLQAQHPPTRDLAHRFLTAVSGMDLGSDPAAWRSWIASLGDAARPAGGEARLFGGSAP